MLQKILQFIVVSAQKYKSVPHIAQHNAGVAFQRKVINMNVFALALYAGTAIKNTGLKEVVNVIWELSVLLAQQASTQQT